MKPPYLRSEQDACRPEGMGIKNLGAGAPLPTTERRCWKPRDHTLLCRSICPCPPFEKSRSRSVTWLKALSARQLKRARDATFCLCRKQRRPRLIKTHVGLQTLLRPRSTGRAGRGHRLGRAGGGAGGSGGVGSAGVDCDRRDVQTGP